MYWERIGEVGYMRFVMRGSGKNGRYSDGQYSVMENCGGALKAQNGVLELLTVGLAGGI